MSSTEGRVQLRCCRNR